MNEGLDGLVAIDQPRRQAERKGNPQPTCGIHLGISISMGYKIRQQFFNRIRMHCKTLYGSGDITERAQGTQIKGHDLDSN